MEDDRQRWIDFMRGESEETLDSLLTETLAELDHRLETVPEGPQQVLDALDRRLAARAKADESWALLDQTLAVYLGAGAATMLTWLILEDPGDEPRMPEVEKRGSPATVGFIRNVLGLFGAELRDAFDVYQQLPNDWRVFFRDVYQDPINNTDFIRIRLQKYSGETVILEGGPDSFLTLARNLLLTLQPIAAPDAFAEEAFSRFAETLSEFWRLVLPEEGGAAAEAADPAEAAGPAVAGT